MILRYLFFSHLNSNNVKNQSSKIKNHLYHDILNKYLCKMLNTKSMYNGKIKNYSEL